MESRVLRVSGCWRVCLGAVLAATAMLLAPRLAAAEPVTVFAAASLRNALQEVQADWNKAGKAPLQISFAGSSALAKQIDNGAPADVYVSANPGWMDYLEKKGLIVANTRFDLLRNSIVLIAPKSSKVKLTIAPGFDLAGALGKNGYLAMANTDAVPAGIYGRKALQSLGVWHTVEARIAQAADVRAALRLVSLGEAPLGIVYRTDANVEPHVRIVGTFPANSHPPIIYPAALTTQAEGNSDARAFLQYLTGAAARRAFERQGFSVIQ